MHYLDLNSVRLWYSDIGSGPPVVFVHPGSCTSLAWDRQKEPVTQAGYRFISFDRPGAGKSIVTDHGDGAPDIDELTALLDHLGVTSADLIASGSGGTTALRFALNYPQRVNSITISASQGGFRDPDLVETLKAAVPPEMMQLPWHVTELSAGYRATDPEGLEQWMHCSQQSSTGPRKTAEKMASAEISTEAVRALNIPTLLIAGGADWFTAPVYVRKIHALLPGSQLEIIREVGHAPHWENPQAWNQVILNFLNRIHDNGGGA